jgi:hypothetical protein
VSSWARRNIRRNFAGRFDTVSVIPSVGSE